MQQTGKVVPLAHLKANYPTAAWLIGRTLAFLDRCKHLSRVIDKDLTDDMKNETHSHWQYIQEGDFMQT